VLGLAAGLCNPIFFTLRLRVEGRHGARAVAHPGYGGVQFEDLIYLIGPITWLGGLEYFFLCYGLGSFGYPAWTVREATRPRSEGT
jgi:hypothetical protein